MGAGQGQQVESNRLRSDDERAELRSLGSRKTGKVNRLGGGLHAVTSLPSKRSMNMRIAGDAEVAGSSIASQRSVEHGLLKRPERREALCRGPGDDACGHVEEALAPQERRQGFVPDDAAAR